MTIHVGTSMCLSWNTFLLVSGAHNGLSLFKLEKVCHTDFGCLTTALNPTDLIALGASTTLTPGA